jgi:hypothetical protein
VKLVLRGPPELHHTSIITAAATDHNAIIRSRFGLYIPRDGDQRIELLNTSNEAVSAINAFAIHPAHLTAESQMPSPSEYMVPVRDLTSTDPPAITVPYRSTLKKFEATWVGPMSGRVEGTPKLNRDGDWFSTGGNLTNGTGVQLRNVYIGFKLPRGDASEDQIFFLPKWEPGVTIDLDKDFKKDVQSVSVEGRHTPDEGKRLIGRMRDWENYWTHYFRRSSTSVGESFIGDLTDNSPKSIPMMTFFDRLAPVRNEPNSTEGDRFELLRRGGRHLDRSASIAAGAMVVLAEAPGKLPFPMTVEGDPVAGDGINFYQYVLPIDRSAVEAANGKARQ